ncbi:MAG: class I SAM-dependent methyltransferase [Ignavibacteriae bacterium]|nr:class I SAM-dependent methyltransferase [Ignavibacteriota bacterium]
MNEQIQYNIAIHNKIAKLYAKKHPEIYNDIEQYRLSVSLSEAVQQINTDSELKTFLDYGCGAGNLTNHLLKFNQNVVSADISQSFLKLVKKTFQNNKLSTLLINGEDLRNVEDYSFDLVATFSVLHHIPDYLKALKDICRVIKKGGILYIDHEASPELWEQKREYMDFKESVKSRLNPLIALNLLNPFWYIRKIKKIRNPRWQVEGDIHVWNDDHIDWEKIENMLKGNNFEILSTQDNLCYNSKYSIEIYNQYKYKCSDVRTLIARKLS